MLELAVQGVMDEGAGGPWLASMSRDQELRFAAQGPASGSHRWPGWYVAGVMVHPAIAVLVLVLTGATPVVDPAALLEQAHAARARGDGAGEQRLLERIVDEFDGTDAAVAAAEELLDVLARRWANKEATPEEMLAASDALDRRALQVVRSKTFRHPRAKRLRNFAWKLAASTVGPGWKGSFPESRYLGCARGYLELAAGLDPRDEYVAHALYGAASCYENAATYSETLVGAGLVADAGRLYARVVAEFPDAEVVRYAVERLVGIAEAGGRLAEVARFGELYAQRFPRGGEAGALLRTAFEIRVGLGDTAQARVDEARHAELRGPLAHALEFFEVRQETAANDEERVTRSREVLRHGKQLPLSVRVVAGVTSGAALWRRACATTGEGGLCVTRDERPRCGRTGWTLHVRDRKAAAEGQLQLAMAVEASRLVASERADFAAAALQARVAVVDAELEKLLREVATDARGGERREAQARRVAQQYERVASELDSDAARVAAQARVGQLAELRAGAGSKCDAAEDRRLLAEATDAYRRCVALASESGAFDATYARVCEAGLERLDPRGYPRLAELFGGDVQVRGRPEWVGLQDAPLR